MVNQRSVVAIYHGDSGRLVSVSRDDLGRRISKTDVGEWSLFVRTADLEASDLQDIRELARVRGVSSDGEYTKICFYGGQARRDAIESTDSLFRQRGIEVYEGDVDPIARYIVDNDVSIQKPRRVYVDLETDSRVPFSRKGDMRILSWVLVDDNGNSQFGLLEKDTDRDERRLLQEFWRSIDEYDQIIAWNGDGFDFPVLAERSQRRGAYIDNPYQWLWLDHLALFKRMNTSSESGAEKESMKLNDIAQVLLGEGKEEPTSEIVERFGNKSLGALAWQLWEAGGSFRQHLLKYCFRDTDLLRKIESKTGYIDLFQTLCEVCRVLPNSKGLEPTRQMDAYMLRLGLVEGYKFPTKKAPELNVKGQYRGAFVLPPRVGAGIIRNVHVADFASLYPSIILTWNMSPETKVIANISTRRPTCLCPETKQRFITDKKGVLPMAIEELIALRKSWNAKKESFPPGTPDWQAANRWATAYKVAANSFYGVVGSIFSRFYDREIAESITQNGVYLITQTIEKAKERGMTLEGGDTDSLFVSGATREEFDAFVVWCNAVLYPILISDLDCITNAIKLTYEKAFDRIVFPAMKRYAGSYLHYKGKDAVAGSKPEIKGIEYKRGDVIYLARKLQATVIDMLVGGLGMVKDVPTDDLTRYHEVISEAQTHVLDDDLPLHEIKLSKALSRSPELYATRYKKDGTKAAKPPHVELALRMSKQGFDVSEGTRIEFIVEDGESPPKTCIQVSEYTNSSQVDRFYLWENLIYPATRRLLEAAYPTEDWSRWAKVRPKKNRSKKSAGASVSIFGPDVIK